MKKQLLKSDYLIIIVFYTFAHGLILLNDGVFWDGWTILNHTSGILLSNVQEIGGDLFRYVFSYMFMGDYVIPIMRITTFLSFLFAALFLNSILTNIKEIDKFSRLIIVLIFALFPVNPARISIATGLYSVCHFLFFLGFWLLTNYVRARKNYFRVFSIIIFFLSFSTNSLIVFFLLPLLYLFYLEKVDIVSFRSFFKKVFKYTDFVALPIIYWAIKQSFFQPSGLYEGYYNTISLKSVILSPVYTIVSFSSSCILIINGFEDSMRGLYVLLFGGLIYILYLLFKKRKIVQSKSSLAFIKFGLFAYFLAVFPYLVIGRSGFHFGSEWQSRDMLLVSLGIAFIICYGLRVILYEFGINKKIQKLFYSILIAAFVISNINYYLEFNRDWFKQLSLIENFNKSDIARYNTCFLFEDETLDLNAIGRSYRFYEYTGLMNQAFGDDKRFGVNLTDFVKVNSDIHHYAKYLEYPRYNFSNFVISDPKYKIIIEYGSYTLSLANTARLLIYKWVNKQEFQRNIQEIVSLKYIKLL